jgi:WD40 repeat protein
MSDANREFHVWDAKTGELIRKSHQEPSSPACLSRDGRLAVAGFEEKLCVWDIEKGEAIMELHVPDKAQGQFRFSSDNKRLIRGDRSGTIRIWNVHAPLPSRAVDKEEFANHVRAVAFTPDGFRGAAGGADRWTTWSIDRNYSFGFHSIDSEVASISFSSDGSTLLLGTGDARSSNNFLLIRDTGFNKRPAEARRLDRQIPIGAPVAGTAVLTADDGRAIAATTDGLIRVWNTSSREVVISGQIDIPIRSAAIHRDLALLATDEGEIRLWDIAGEKEVGRLIGHSAPVRTVAVSADGRLAVTGGDDRTVRVWNIKAREQFAEFSEHEGTVRSVAISQYGTLILSGSDDGRVGVWDVKSQKRLFWLEGHEMGVESVAIAPSGRQALSGSADGTLFLWSLDRD